MFVPSASACCGTSRRSSSSLISPCVITIIILPTWRHHWERRPHHYHRLIPPLASIICGHIGLSGLFWVSGDGRGAGGGGEVEGGMRGRGCLPRHPGPLGRLKSACVMVDTITMQDISVLEPHSAAVTGHLLIKAARCCVI